MTFSGQTSDPAGRVDVIDCVDDTAWLKHMLDGSLQNDVPGGRHYTTLWWRPSAVFGR